MGGGKFWSFDPSLTACYCVRPVGPFLRVSCSSVGCVVRFSIFSELFWIGRVVYPSFFNIIHAALLHGLKKKHG